MNIALPLRRVLALGLLALLSACQSNPPQAESAEPPKASVQFLDVQGFDRDLSRAMAAPLPAVDVAFYDRITPSALPDRLQKWLASVESSGGSVKVVPPKSTVAAKSPFLLISAASSLWSASKATREYTQEAQFKVAHSYNAEIQLKIDDKGDTIVDKVLFIQRKP